MKQSQLIFKLALLVGWGVGITLSGGQSLVYATEAPNTPSQTPSNTSARVAPLATRLVLSIQERKVYAYQGEQIIATFPVAVGKKGWETPTGNFTVIKMVKNPAWEHPWNGKLVPPGPNNPLGERWIGFWTDGKNTIGFHGTPQEHLIGRAVSHGCVRMRNRDVKALFDLVQMGTPVIVKP